ncbi:Nmad5 family putative nucleotide modification protein [Photorhabdus viridis]|uniref:Nmad5 family putative nucleotide modification protein n=1 Tax=Photorhabdus viridis TaxID=3163327 RepID=UPI003306B402
MYEDRKKVSELNNKNEEIINNVHAILNSITTTKRLIEIWPEAKDLIPSEEIRSINTSLSVKVEDLNKMIGIPKIED